MRNIFLKLFLLMGLTGSASLGTSFLGATPAQAGLDNNPFEGFYLGLRFDYNKESANAAYTQIAGEETSGFTGITDETSGNGLGGGFYGGYGMSLGPVYTSIEAGWAIGGGAGRVTDGTAEFGIKNGNTFDINGRVGVVPSDRFLIYGLFGYAATKYNGDGFEGDVGERLNGFRYGGGLEVGVFEDVALRIEYTRAEFGSTTFTQGVDQFTFDPSEQRLSIGLVLHMN
ncbi:outer membrane protein [Luteithermobacter gelatinilyticus]|uniref:outer membrane protein n=1 Tax=Luteithermobacter gelatinilyticus TaxID=2582913 RepID=UPI00143DB8DE|nr:outer membrane beta-barrel protein [Luteithermobacter gelatinilyticus]|tara:strand:- start:9120 stop:9803 length:684 start_codon:yes stop_codon:yes gene_type:complete